MPYREPFIAERRQATFCEGSFGASRVSLVVRGVIRVKDLSVRIFNT